MQDKQLRCIFNILKWTWPPGSPNTPSPYLLQGLIGTSHPLPWTFQLRGWASPPKEALPYVMQPFCSLPLFLTLHLLAQCVHPLSVFLLLLPCVSLPPALFPGNNEPAQEWLLNESAFIHFNLAWIGSFHWRIITSTLTENNIAYNFTIAQGILRVATKKRSSIVSEVGEKSR